MHLMRSAPPAISVRTFVRTSASSRTTPTRSPSGRPIDGASPVTSPPPPGQVMYAPAHCIRGPGVQPRSIASRSATSTKAQNVPTSRTVVNPARSVSRALRTPLIASWAGVTSIAGIPAYSISPTRWAWQSISPGTTQSPSMASGRASPGTGVVRAQDRLDPVAGDEDPPVGQPRALDDVEEVGRVDEDPVGHGVSVATATAGPWSRCAGRSGYHDRHDRRRPRPCRSPATTPRTASSSASRWRCSSASSSTSR